MDTLLAEQKIEKFGGTTRFTTDAVDDLIQGRGGVLRMEPEKGSPIAFVAVPSRDEAAAIKTLYFALASGSAPGSKELRDYVTEQVGYDPDWHDIGERHERVEATF